MSPAIRLLRRLLVFVLSLSMGVELDRPATVGEMKRDRIGRPPTIGWVSGSLIFAACAILAAMLASDWGGGPSDALLWVARAVLVAGGLIVGLRSVDNPSVRSALIALTVPLPTLGLGWVLMAGLSQSEADLPDVTQTVVIAYLLFVLPLLVVLAARGTSARRSAESR